MTRFPLIVLAGCVLGGTLSSTARAEDADNRQGQFAPAPPVSNGAGDDADKEIQRRAKFKNLHFAFALTTWASLAATNVIGTIRYANVIGFGDPLCAEGSTPILGRAWGCGDGLKYQHLVSASFTTMSYITARTFAALMPDPYDAASGSSERARKLVTHRALSWVHLAGMIAMPILGFATAGTTDPDAKAALATSHLVVGYTTLAAVSAAGAIMVF